MDIAHSLKNGTCQIHENCIYSLDITCVSNFIGRLFSLRCSVDPYKECLISFSDGSLCPVLKAHIKRDYTGCLLFSHSIPKSVMPKSLFSVREARVYAVLPAFLQKCPKFRALLTPAAVPALTLQPLRAFWVMQNESFSCSKSERKAQSSPVVLLVWEQATRMKTEQRPGAVVRGPPASALRGRVHSESSLYPLVAHYKTFF